MNYSQHPTCVFCRKPRALHNAMTLACPIKTRQWSTNHYHKTNKWKAPVDHKLKPGELEIEDCDGDEL